MTKIIKKYKELILYVLFGGLTTVVNFAVFWLFTQILGESLYLFNNAVAWIASVAFAYVTNKLFVFESKSTNIKVVAKELVQFVWARVFSFAIEEAGIWLFVDVLDYGSKSVALLGIDISGQMIAKIFLAVIVVILNYFFSKFIIFKNKKREV